MASAEWEFACAVHNLFTALSTGHLTSQALNAQAADPGRDSASAPERHDNSSPGRDRYQRLSSQINSPHRSVHGATTTT